MEGIEYADYPVFKGLQKPLEFLGFQGRYIYWAAGTAGGGILGFIIGYVSAGFVVALIIISVILSVGGIAIMVKQRQGLHTKRTDKGVFVFVHSRRIS